MAIDLRQAAIRLEEQARRLREIADTVIQSAVRKSLLDVADICEGIAAEMAAEHRGRSGTGPSPDQASLPLKKRP